MGPVGCQEGMSGSRMGPYGSVYQSYTDTEQSSDPSGLVGSRRAKTAFRRVSVGTLTGFHRNPVLARQDPTGLDGSLDCPVLVHD